MSNLSIILICLGLALLMLLAYAAARPDEFRVERRLRIAAPADQLWPLVSELRAFNRWNPYERKDPLIKSTYSGAASGVWRRPSANASAATRRVRPALTTGRVMTIPGYGSDISEGAEGHHHTAGQGFPPQSRVVGSG